MIWKLQLKVEAIPNDLLTRIEAANLYEPKNVGYITETNADAKYATKQEIIGISDGGYYDTQRVIKDNVVEKKLESTSGALLKERRKFNEFTLEIIDTVGNIQQALSFDTSGFKVNDSALLAESGLNSRLSSYYTKTEVDNELTGIKADINDINSKYFPKVRWGSYRTHNNNRDNF